MRLFAVALVTALVPGSLFAQFAAPKSNPPDEPTRKAILAKTEKLGKELTELRRLNVRDPILAEVEIFHKAAVWIVRHNEFYHKDSADWTEKVLDRGLLRASQAAQGEGPWFHQAGIEELRAYRSQIDGSVQPFAVTYPADYGKDPRKKWRLDVVLHGRDSSISEVKFLYQHGTGKAAAKGQEFVRLDIYGRGNNAYRWAGETDVFEAIQAFQTVEQGLGRQALLDPTRIVLRGFSMGGAGSWHIGLRHPDRWCVIGPGAGFTTTHGYVGKMPDQLVPYQEKCLRIYDAVDYAENAANVPVVAYGGSDDPQLQAAKNIEAKLKPLGIPMKLLVAPGLKHEFPAAWQKKAEELYAEYTIPGRGREEYPNKIRFVTYTLKSPSCAWVEILGLGKHYEQARVEAEKTDAGFTLKTANVRSLRLRVQDLDAGAKVPVKIDGQQLSPRVRGSQNQLFIYLERHGERWAEALPQRLFVDRLRRLQKTTGLQGPIDDAFTTGFLCVRGTGKPWHTATQAYIDADLKRFRAEWDTYLRGDLPVKNDEEVTDDDINSKNLILFGDPNSNSILAQIADRLPMKWTREAIELAGKSYAASEHVPALIYPSPLNTARYVVINSGHTFHAPDFQGTNALLYPRLGDFAVLKLGKDALDVTPATAGLFDEFWQVPKE
jgi:hypothetical protein